MRAKAWSISAVGRSPTAGSARHAAAARMPASTMSIGRLAENSIKELPRAFPNLCQFSIEAPVVQVFGRPAAHQLGQNAHLLRSGRQLAFGVPHGNAQTMIDGTVKSRRIAEKLRIFPLQVAHFFDYVDAFRRIQHLEENPRSSQAQVHQREVDIVVTAAPRFERIAGALLLL